MANRSEKIVKPENCALAIAIPTSINAFRIHQDRTKSFAQMFENGWPEYSQAIVAPFQKHRPEIARLKAQLHMDLTLQKFGDLFNSEATDVVILFAHWDTDSIEFFDGPTNVASIVEKVPRTYMGILDLCVCRQDQLPIALRRERPDCVIGFTNKGATPYLWLYFYVLVFKYLNEYDMTYFEAFEKAVSAIFKVRRSKIA